MTEHDMSPHEIALQNLRLDEQDDATDATLNDLIAWARTNYIRINARRAITGMTLDMLHRDEPLPTVLTPGVRFPNPVQDEQAAMLLAAALVRIGELGTLRDEMRAFMLTLSDRQPWDVRKMLEKVLNALETTVGTKG